MIRARTLLLTVIAVAVLPAASATAQPGQLDRTFGRNGIVRLGEAYRPLFSSAWANAGITVEHMPQALFSRRLLTIGETGVAKVVRCSSHHSLNPDGSLVRLNGPSWDTSAQWASRRCSTSGAATIRFATTNAARLFGQSGLPVFEPKGSELRITVASRDGMLAVLDGHVIALDRAGQLIPGRPAITLSGKETTIKEVAPGPQNTVYVLASASQSAVAGHLLRFLPTGEPDPAFTSPAVDAYATRLLVGPDGTVVPWGLDISRLEVVLPTGAKVPIAESLTKKLIEPTVTFDTEGRVLFATRTAGLVRLTPSTGNVTVLRRFSGGFRPDGALVVDGRNRIVVLGSYRKISRCGPHADCGDNDMFSVPAIMRLAG